MSTATATATCMLLNDHPFHQLIGNVDVDYLRDVSLALLHDFAGTSPTTFLSTL